MCVCVCVRGEGGVSMVSSDEWNIVRGRGSAYRLVAGDYIGGRCAETCVMDGGGELDRFKHRNIIRW